MEATWEDSSQTSKRFHIRDAKTVFPKDDPNAKRSDINLFAANNTIISTYGEKDLVLNLRLKRPVTWNFTIADVPNPIIGADS